MAQIVITNTTTNEVPITELYAKVPAGVGQTLTIDRPQSDFGRLKSLMDAILAGSVTIGITYTAAELASGLLIPPSSVNPSNIAAVAAADKVAPAMTIRVAIPAGAGGAPDDVSIYALNALPFKFRVLDAHMKVSTAVALASVELRDKTGGLGTLLATMDAAVTGRNEMTDDVTAVAAPSAITGLFLRRSDSGVAGELIASIRKES